jgi:hypothetical protein
LQVLFLSLVFRSSLCFQPELSSCAVADRHPANNLFNNPPSKI